VQSKSIQHVGCPTTVHRFVLLKRKDSGPAQKVNNDSNKEDRTE